MQSTSCEMPGWMKHKLESRLLGEISITSDADDTTHMAECEEELKSLLMKVKEEREKASLKFNIQKTKIMGSSPITSWQIDGETMETVTDYFLGLQTTENGDCSHEIKRYLLLGRKAVTNLVNILILLLLLFCFTILYWFCHTSEHIKKQRHHFADKGPSSQTYGFYSTHVWMRELDHKES